MKHSLSISLIIATYNWPQALELVLLALLKQVSLPQEIIIADDGSGAETATLIRRFDNRLPVPVKHIWHPDAGFRKTVILNKAVKAATGDYIVQIDGDVIPNRYFIKDHRRLAEPGTFVRGTRAHLSQAATLRAFERKQTSFHFYSKGVKHRNNAVRAPLLLPLGVKKSAASHSVRGSNLAFWKSDFMRVNGYNNDLTGWGHEDEELAARLVNSGIRKKKVKLAAIQYHLYHRVASQEQESRHAMLLKQVRTQKIIRCNNGVDQITERYDEK